jgi:endoglycosylceramidase
MPNVRVLPLALLLPACAPPAPDGALADDTAPASTDALVARDGALFDADGREVLLRGVNARVDGLFDVTFDDGRTPLEPIPPFGEDDCRLLGEDLGLDLLRLPVSWSAIEPTRGSYDDAYVARVADVARACAAHGVLTLVDLHQDAFSKEIGEDGAPLWAIVPAPDALLEGPLDDLGARRTSGQVLRAFASLYDDAGGLWDAYAAMAAHLAAGLRDVPGVVALELHNEPVLYSGLERLDAFHAHVAAAVRQAAPELTVAIEPESLRNLTDASAPRGPFPLADVVYAPHLYTGVFQDDWTLGDTARIDASADGMRAEAEVVGGALLVGELGADPRTDLGRAWTDAALDALDRVRAGWAYWVYEEWSQGGWGLYDADDGRRGTPRDDAATRLARPYPQRVDGRLAAVAWDGHARILTVDLTDAGGGEHVVAASARVWPDGVRVTCDGTPVDAVDESTPGRVSFACLGARMVLTPR